MSFFLKSENGKEAFPIFESNPPLNITELAQFELDQLINDMIVDALDTDGIDHHDQSNHASGSASNFGDVDKNTGINDLMAFIAMVNKQAKARSHASGKRDAGKKSSTFDGTTHSNHQSNASE